MNKATKKNQIINLFLLLLSIIAFRVHAQTYNFNHYSLKDGLIQSNVNDILQDRKGYIWFATDGGLSKFNGQTFENFSTNEGLSEASVNTICEDNDGQIWVGHSLGKISLYDGQKFNNLEINLKEKPSRICDISKNKQGNIWISTIGGGALYLNTSTKELKQYSTNQNLSDVVFMSYTDATGKAWFVTDIGIKYFDAEKDSFIFFKPKGFPFFDYTCMTQDQQGDYWFGTANQGIVHYNSKNGTST